MLVMTTVIQVMTELGSMYKLPIEIIRRIFEEASRPMVVWIQKRARGRRIKKKMDRLRIKDWQFESGHHVVFRRYIHYPRDAMLRPLKWHKEYGNPNWDWDNVV